MTLLNAKVLPYDEPVTRDFMMYGYGSLHDKFIAKTVLAGVAPWVIDQAVEALVNMNVEFRVYNYGNMYLFEYNEAQDGLRVMWLGIPCMKPTVNYLRVRVDIESRVRYQLVVRSYIEVETDLPEELVDMIMEYNHATGDTPMTGFDVPHSHYPPRFGDPAFSSTPDEVPLDKFLTICKPFEWYGGMDSNHVIYN